jgi:RNA polymerase II C-terminal domain phosphatase-like 3/4
VENNLWTKLRPGVYDLLVAARELFELHIYTMGDRRYAREVARILDPGAPQALRN